MTDAAPSDAERIRELEVHVFALESLIAAHHESLMNILRSMPLMVMAGQESRPAAERRELGAQAERELAEAVNSLNALRFSVRRAGNSAGPESGRKS